MDLSYVDIQVNGYSGIDFSNPCLTLDDIRTVSRMLREKGVVGYCPTMITSSMETYKHNLPLIAKAAQENSEGAAVLGVHLEGPFISPEDGARGIHQAKYVMPPDRELFEQLADLSENTQAIITIAPDQPGAIELIQDITEKRKTTVSLGHHLATHRQIADAVQAGAAAATHVGNGLPTMIHRHKNPLWTILSDDRLSACIITDGFHLPIPLIRVILKTKPIDKVILTSDLMHFGGLHSGTYSLGGVPVILEDNGWLHQADSSQLAGAALSIDQCARFLHHSLSVPIEDIRKMVYNNPLKLINRAL
jgi:N-acetylglucosamine-6-phosphate deacetylase